MKCPFGNNRKLRQRFARKFRCSADAVDSPIHGLSGGRLVRLKSIRPLLITKFCSSAEIRKLFYFPRAAHCCRLCLLAGE